MEIKPEYEIFGREVKFDELTPIKKISQPGILSKTHFFNYSALHELLSEFDFFIQDNLIVYFRNICGGMAPNFDDKKRNWWDSLQQFSSNLKDFPAGIKMEYWYGPDGKEYSSPDFDEKKKPYQAFFRLFDNAIQGFSCFVCEDKAGIGFRSERTNYEAIKPGEALIHDDYTRWEGDKKVFSQSAKMLHDAFDEMQRDHKIGISGLSYENPEIRIINPQMGAVISRLVDDNSVNIFIDNPTLEQIVQKHKKDRLLRI